MTTALARTLRTVQFADQIQSTGPLEFLTDGTNLYAAHCLLDENGNPLPLSTSPLVTGQIQVSNFPGTQPVTDAAVEANTAAIEAALGGTLKISAVALPLPALAAQDGTDGTGIAGPAGGVGIRGWLSGIYSVLGSLLGLSSPVQPICSSQLEGAHLLKAAAGSLASVSVAIGATGGWLLLLDTNVIPADGAVAPIAAVPVQTNGSNGGVTLTFRTPLKFLNGCVAVFSTNGPFIKAASASAYFSAQVS